MNRGNALIALGITRWLPKRQLPGACPAPVWQRRTALAPAPQIETPAAPQPARRGRELPRNNAPARPVTRTERPSPQSAGRTVRQVKGSQELRYCAVLRPLVDGWFLLSEGDPVAGSPVARLFIQDLLHAIGLDASMIGEARRLDWPPPGGERLATDPVMGREALQAFLQTTDGARVLCVSSRISELLGKDRPELICIPDLTAIMADARARREAWLLLSRINERKS